MRTPRGGHIDDLEQREFSRVRKGYEPSEVRATLVQTSAELRRLRAERGRLSDELAAARAETERVRRQAEEAPAVLPDDAELTRVLGEEMVKLLDDARTAAAGIAERAEETGERTRSEAEAEATERMDRLEHELGERRADAEAEEREILERANSVLAERTELADDAGAELKAQAEAALAEARDAAREHIEAGKDEGRRLVVEAKTFRERILRDLAGRRKLARKQLEAMRAAQERLLGAFTACAVAVESATSELHTALPEAKVAADDAAKRVTDDIEDVVEAMEAAIATGELPAVVMGEIGRPDLSGRTALLSAALPVRHEERAEPEQPITTDAVAGHEDAAEESDAAGSSAVFDHVEQDDLDEDEPDASALADEAGDQAAPHVDTEHLVPADQLADAEPSDVPGDTADLSDDTADLPDDTAALPDDTAALPDDSATGEHPAVGAETEWTSLDLADLVDGPAAALQVGTTPDAANEATPSGRDHLRLVPGEDDDTAPVDDTAASGDGASPGDGAVADEVSADEVPAGAGSDGALVQADSDAATDEAEADQAPVAGDLFARLRAERDEAVAQARETLGVNDDPAELADADADADDADGNEAIAGSVDEGDTALVVEAEEADQILDNRDDAIGPIERGVSRRVKRLVDDEQNELLDALRRSRRNVTLAALLPEAEQQVASLMELLGSDLTDAVAAGATSVAARSGTPVALGRANLERLAALLEPTVAARLVNPWRDEVAAMIAAESDRGQLSEQVRAAYRERKTVALPELASGVVVVAFNVGVAAAAKPGPGLEWVLDHGGERAEAHLPRIRGGNPVGLVEALSSPEVPVGCRCMLVTRAR